jgi:hypothetical protein
MCNSSIREEEEHALRNKWRRNTRRKVTGFLLALSLMVGMLPLPSAWAAAPNYDSYNGFTTSEEPVLPAQEVHPKLWFSASETNAMYAKRNADAYAKSLWDSISSSPYLTVPLPPVTTASCSDSALHSYYGDMARIAKYNAFMFAMEGNATHKDRAIAALKRAFDGPIYSCDPVASSSPVDETYRALWVQNFAAAYDWVHSVLTPEDDQAIRTIFAKEAELTFQEIDKWGPRPHNHRSKPAWGLGSLALVMSDHPDAAKWLRRALEMANTNTKYFFSSDGVYREGSQYYIYSHINFLPFLYHYKNVSGVDLFRVYKPAFEWEFQVSNNKGWMPNFADSYIRHNHLNMVASQFMTAEDTSSLHPTAKWGNLFQWRYSTTDKSPWGGEFGNNTGASYDDTMDLDRYLSYDPSVEPIAPTGSGTSFFNEGGQTIFRNNWNLNDPKSRYLLFQGVAEMDNHNQFDHLSFILHAENQMMASDSGYSRSAYGDDVRRTWYRTAPAHNTVTLNGKWPVDIAEGVNPVSKYSIDTDFFDFQQKEARFIEISNDTSKGENPLEYPPDSESLGYIQRAIAFPNQEYFVAADKLWTKNNSQQTFDLYLHGGRGTMQGSGNFRQWIYANDPYGSSSKLSSWIFSNQATLTNKKGEVSYVKDDFINGDYVQATVQADKTNFMQILIPQPIAASTPVVTELSDTQRVGGTVEMDGNLDTYVVQSGTGEVSLGKLTTNGDFAYVRDRGLVDQYAVRQATSLSYAGNELYRSSERITLAMNTSERTKLTGKITTDAPGLTYSAGFKLPAGKTASTAMFNQAPVTVANVNGYAEFTALVGEGELVIQLVDSGVPDTTAPAQITDLGGQGDGHGAVKLTWTATGNDGSLGTAAYYDVRYSTGPINEANWNDAQQATGEPKPNASGAAEAMTVRGLQSGTSYYFALKVGDEAGNMSALSNVIAATTVTVEDTVAPGAVTDLALAAAGETSAQLRWSAPGDDGYMGTATSYEIRYSSSPIMNEAQWATAKQASGAPLPESAGTSQTATINGLTAGRTYFFSIRSTDEANNVSPLSNTVFVAMDDAATVSKLQVTGVTASSHDGNIPENTIDGNMSTRWSAQSLGNLGSRTPEWIQFDLGAINKVSYIKLAYASGNVRKSYFDLEVSTDGVNWTEAAQGIETSGATLEFETYELHQLNAKYVKLIGYGNTSSGWNSINEVAIYGLAVDDLPPVSLGKVTFTDFADNPVTTLAPSSFLKVHAPVTNNQDDPRKMSSIIALYRPDHAIEKMVLVTSEVEGWGTESFNGGFTLPDQTNGYYVKVFVWDSLEGMQPLTEAVQFPN